MPNVAWSSCHVSSIRSKISKSGTHTKPVSEYFSLIQSCQSSTFWPCICLARAPCGLLYHTMICLWWPIRLLIKNPLHEINILLHLEMWSYVDAPIMLPVYIYLKSATQHIVHQKLATYDAYGSAESRTWNLIHKFWLTSWSQFLLLSNDCERM